MRPTRTPWLAVALLLVACGGGSDGTTPPPAPPPAPPPPAPPTVATVTLAGVPAGALPSGATVTLTATALDAAGLVVGGRPVTWTSDAPAVATVAGGVVTAVDRGSTAITATVDGRSASATIAVVTPAARIALAPAGGVLLPGDTLHLDARVLDARGRPAPEAGTPTLAVAAPGVATLAGGVLTAVAPGTATVTATLGALTATTRLAVHPGGGTRVGALAALDSVAVAELARLAIPAASVAVARGGRLLFARAYGWADTATRRMAAVGHLFRVGSTSKPLTAVAVLRLVQEGRLRLDDRPFTMLDDLLPRAGHGEDPRLAQVTVRDLLQHSAGWHESRAVDDSLWRAVSRDGLLEPRQFLRYGRSVPLATSPGTAYAYTNMGYVVLGRLVERVTGIPYAQWVRESILRPAGAEGMVFGRTPLAQRDPREVACHDGLPATTGRFGTGRTCDVTPVQEYADASGAWVASATDMARWISITDGAPGGAGARADVLTPETVAAMTARPAHATSGAAGGAYHALGWQVVPEAGGATWVHTGAQAGGDGYVARLADGTVVVILANLTRGRGTGGASLDAALVPAIRRVAAWPAGTPF